jgi:cobalt-zinc-cadmium efflux system protein
MDTHNHSHPQEQHGHSPGHGHEHHHNYKHVAFQRLWLSLLITLSVMVIEIVGGWISGSIALISDAGHMFTHAFAIAVSLLGIKIARIPRCHHRTFGLLRAEVVAAFVNGLFLLLVSLWIIVESILRALQPQDILTTQMFAVAVLGLLVNVLSMYLLEGSRHGDLNVRSVFLHMIGDAVSSVAIIIAAVIIRYTHWMWLDPAISSAIAIWISIWALHLLKESLRVLLEIAPPGIVSQEISEQMKEKFPQIVDTRNERLWTISEDVTVFSAYIHIDKNHPSTTSPDDLCTHINRWLHDTYEIKESTLQLY